MQTTGYSGTPLAKKLGIKAGFKITLINAPAYYFDLFTDMSAGIVISTDANAQKNFIHLFTRDKAEYVSLLPQLKGQIVQNGMIWVSWPKRASKVTTDITEGFVRNYALACGLVDIKVCAVDEVWSGLKMVIPLVDRAK